jgi:murein L,D-transpeptidase YafK
MRHFLILASLFIFSFYVMTPVYANEYQLLISKKKNELIVESFGQVVKKYYIASGKGGEGTKRLRGDSKTPLGIYQVANVKESSRFHFFIQLDYPNLLDAWYGYKNKIIDSNEFKRIAKAYSKREAPPQDTELGGFIGIHGLGITNEEKLNIHESFDWTDGCIALTNEEINDLKKFVLIGTQVIIRE